MNPVVQGFKSSVTCLALVMWVNFISPAISYGQNTGDAEENSLAQPVTAPVKVDGKILFRVKGISSYPAETRAAAISNRIKKAAANPSFPQDSVIIKAAADRVMIYAGNTLVMNVYDNDADMEGVNKDVLAQIFQQKIINAIDAYRNDRTKSSLIRKAIYAAGSAVLLILIMFLLVWLIRKIKKGLEAKIRSRVDTVEHFSFKLIESGNLWKAINLIFKALKILLIVTTIIAFIEYILGLFPWTRNVAATFLSYIIDPLASIGRGLLNYLPNVVYLIFIFLITKYLLKIIKLLFTGVSNETIKIKGFYPEWSMPTFRLLKILIIAFAIILSYPYIPGSGTVAFKGVTIFIGALFSLGSSSFIGNIVSGYSMSYRRAFKKGDRIEVDNHIGFVEEQSLLVTRLTSHKNEEIVVPNSVLLNSHIVNYSAREEAAGLILHTTVGIGYETSWRQVDAMLRLAADRTEGLLKEPSPFVLKKSLNDFAIIYEINAYCKDVRRINRYYTSLHQNILDVFNENNVQIMTPAYVHDPESPKIVPKDQWDVPLAGK